MEKGFEPIAKALFVNYESLYDIDMETGAYACFRESGPAERFRLEKRGEDFFADAQELIDRLVAEEDRAYVREMLSRGVLAAGTENDGHSSFIYRVVKDGREVFHKIRAKRETVAGAEHLYLGVRDIDYLIRREMEHAEELQKQAMEKEELERQLQLSRIRNFTGQMQPHFLYNALGSIQEIMLEDVDYASGLLGDFTTYLRGCIRSMSGDEPIPFQQEMENIRAYVNIERMRFGDKLRIVYDIRSQDFQVLPLSIQPLVENAIRHGVYQRGKAGGTVVISAEKKEGFAEVRIEDDGVGFDYGKYLKEMKTGERESAGLRNLKFRLEKVMDAEIRLQSSPGKGTVATVRIPVTGGEKQ